VIFYFLIIRPQNKKQKDAKKMIEAVKKGDKVVTVGGVHGVVSSVKDGTVIVKVDENTKIEFSKSAISAVTAKGEIEATPEKSAEEKK
jgi:preprotein translocase subunit YajC